MVATWLAPRRAAAHGWLFGVLVFVIDVRTVTAPDTRWPTGLGIPLLILVVPQTWLGVRLGRRLRRHPDEHEAGA